MQVDWPPTAHWRQAPDLSTRLHRLPSTRPRRSKRAARSPPSPRLRAGLHLWRVYFAAEAIRQAVRTAWPGLNGSGRHALRAQI